MNDYIKKLKDLISIFENYGFCKGAAAMDKNGLDCDPNSKEASYFCLLGGMERADMISLSPIYRRFYAELNDFADPWGPVGTNNRKGIAYINDNVILNKNHLLQVLNKILNKYEPTNYEI